MNYRPQGGWLHVIHGCMFAGKTETLIREITRAEIGKRKVMVFKAAIDLRYKEGGTKIVTHSGASANCILIPTNRSWNIIEYVESEEYMSAEFEPHTDPPSIIAIDEVQFFGEDIIPTIQYLVNKGYQVIAAGLDQDYRGEPFGPMGSLVAMADSTEKLYAVCSVCGEPYATKTQRLKADGSPAAIDEPTIVVGSTDRYQARCRNCWEVGPAQGGLEHDRCSQDL